MGTKRPKCESPGENHLGIQELTMAGLTGLEPAALGVTGRYSNQLSYNPITEKIPNARRYSTYGEAVVKKIFAFLKQIQHQEKVFILFMFNQFC